MNHYDDFFEIIFDRLMESEFNFNNSPQERKHWTGGAVGRGELKGSKYGISAMSYPDQDIINLTKEQAMEIYYYDFYSPFKDEFSIPQCVMFQFLDSVIEHGIHHSVVFLQNALKVKPDGILGSVTIGAMNLFCILSRRGWILSLIIQAEKSIPKSGKNERLVTLNMQ